MANAAHSHQTRHRTRLGKELLKSQLIQGKKPTKTAKIITTAAKLSRSNDVVERRSTESEIGQPKFTAGPRLRACWSNPALGSALHFKSTASSSNYRQQSDTCLGEEGTMANFQEFNFATPCSSASEIRIREEWIMALSTRNSLTEMTDGMNQTMAPTSFGQWNEIQSWNSEHQQEMIMAEMCLSEVPGLIQNESSGLVNSSLAMPDSNETRSAVVGDNGILTGIYRSLSTICHHFPSWIAHLIVYLPYIFASVNMLTAIVAKMYELYTCGIEPDSLCEAAMNFFDPEIRTNRCPKKM